MAPSAEQALSILRDSSRFQWYLIPFLLVLIHILFTEIGKKNWPLICGALAFWGMEWHAEIWNAVIFHLTGYAPLWGTPGATAYQVLIGLNIEISMMFFIMGFATIRVLPEDRNKKYFGIPNRPAVAALMAALCILVEAVLNNIGALTWEYWWWGAKFPFLLFLVAYWPLFLVAYRVFDMKTLRSRVIALAALYGFDALLVIIFGVWLGWI
jgi:hypothetical protein